MEVVCRHTFAGIGFCGKRVHIPLQRSLFPRWNTACRTRSKALLSHRIPIARGELGFAKNVRSLHKQTLRKHPIANCRSCYKYERRTAVSDTSWNPSRRLNPSPSTSRFLHATCAGGGQSYLTSYMYLLVSHRDTTTTQLTSSSTTFFQKLSKCRASASRKQRRQRRKNHVCIKRDSLFMMLQKHAMQINS